MYCINLHLCVLEHPVVLLIVKDAYRGATCVGTRVWGEKRMGLEKNPGILHNLVCVTSKAMMDRHLGEDHFVILITYLWKSFHKQMSL